MFKNTGGTHRFQIHGGDVIFGEGQKSEFDEKKVNFKSLCTHKSFDIRKILLTRGEPTHKLLVTRFLADSGTLTRRGGIRKLFFISFLKYGGELVCAKKNANFTKFVTHKSFDTNFYIHFSWTAYP